LDLHERRGNCLGCWKKSDAKLATLMLEDPRIFDFTDYLESEYGRVGPEFKRDPGCPPRTFFRGNRSTTDLRRQFARWMGEAAKILDLPENKREDSGCSESCELYPMASLDEAA
jgi:hypothetical protein